MVQWRTGRDAKPRDDEDVGELRTRLARAEAELTELRRERDACRNRAAVRPEFDRALLSYGGTVQCSQPSMGELTAALRDEGGRVREATRASRSTTELVRRMNEGVAALLSDSDRAGESVRGLESSARDVQSVVRLVSQVAEQSHLLAVNAAIEAAHAGEAGRGFAIVADEVRALAGRTRQAAVEMTRLVGAIRSGADAALTDLGEVRDRATRLGAEGTEAVDGLSAVAGLAGEVGTALDRAALRSFAELAKVDHLVWKFEVYKVVLGASPRPADEFSSHRVCRLGKWYYEGDGAERFSRVDGYDQLAEPHAGVHDAGREAVSRAHAKDLDAALAAVLRMEAASVQVLSCLQRMGAAV